MSETDVAASAVACPTCAEPVEPADSYCEACGADLKQTRSDSPADVKPCVECGAAPADIGADGYCGQCGHKQPDPRDHLEIDLGRLAGVTDRGITHWRNEDAMSFALANDGFVIVVCDGVSTSQNPQIASQLAVDAARTFLVSAAASTPGGIPDAMVRAVGIAQEAASGVEYDKTNEVGPASCTYVAAVLLGTTLTVAWVGDSRAYWIDEAGARQISRDDSWAAEQIDSGQMTPEAAYADKRAHAITRWLGADAGDTTPRVVEVAVSGDGLVLVCSDGLWNYAPEPDDMAKLVGPIGEEEPIVLARRLCEFAKTSGGHDNIAVVVAPVRLSTTEEEAAGS